MVDERNAIHVPCRRSSDEAKPKGKSKNEFLKSPHAPTKLMISIVLHQKMFETDRACNR